MGGDSATIGVTMPLWGVTMLPWGVTMSPWGGDSATMGGRHHGCPQAGGFVPVLLLTAAAVTFVLYPHLRPR